MTDGIDPARHAAHHHQAARRQLAPQPLRHLRSIKRWPPRPHDADARQIQHLRVPAHVEHHRRIVDLQQGLRIFRIGPIQQPAAIDAPRLRQLFFSPLEGLLLEDGLRHRRWQLARF
jgi:hypothetical protein